MAFVHVGIFCAPCSDSKWCEWLCPSKIYWGWALYLSEGDQYYFLIRSRYIYFDAVGWSGVRRGSEANVWLSSGPRWLMITYAVHSPRGPDNNNTSPLVARNWESYVSLSRSSYCQRLCPTGVVFKYADFALVYWIELGILPHRSLLQQSLSNWVFSLATRWVNAV